MSVTRPRVVIVGGGFAGLYAARALDPGRVDVTIIDRRNHHLFQPLLYQVATATLNPSEIAMPIRHLVRDQTVLLGDVTGIDVANRQVVMRDGRVPYDHLILATGVTHSFFGHDEWSQHALGLKSVEDALAIRRQFLLAFEAAEREADPERRRDWMTFAIVGAGPTGVELAGAMAEVARQSLRNEFQRIKPEDARIILVEGMPRVLPAYPEELSAKAEVSLEELGVEVRTNARVTHIDATGLTIGEERIRARTVLWAAGVAGSPVAKSLGVPLDRAGRVQVTPRLTVPGHEEIMVVGDLAALEQDGGPIPGVAPAAMQMGKHAAKNIERVLDGQSMEPFRYWDRGTFSVIGRGSAVGLLFAKYKSSGFFAWWSWLFIHIFFLIGFRNRLVVLVNWAYSYFAARRGMRLITGAPPELLEARTPEAPAVRSDSREARSPLH